MPVLEPEPLAAVPIALSPGTDPQLLKAMDNGGSTIWVTFALRCTLAWLKEQPRNGVCVAAGFVNSRMKLCSGLCLRSADTLSGCRSPSRRCFVLCINLQSLP